MNERDFELILRAKKQVESERNMRSFLIVGLVFCASLRLVGFELPYLYLLMFMILFASLIFFSELIANFGRVSKTDLIELIEQHIHQNPESLTLYAEIKNKG